MAEKKLFKFEADVTAKITGHIYAKNAEEAAAQIYYNEYDEIDLIEITRVEDAREIEEDIE